MIRRYSVDPSTSMGGPLYSKDSVMESSFLDSLAMGFNSNFFGRLFRRWFSDVIGYANEARFGP